MKPKSKLLSISGATTSILSRMFIEIEPMRRIKTVTEYSKELDVSRGTIQNSIKFLTENNAIKLESRGQLGTFIIEKDLIKLLQISGLNYIVGAMPLPYSKRYEGLSTAIIQSIENNLNIPINMSYMRGSKNRVEMVLSGRCDFAIMSKFAALEAIKENENLEIVKEFGEYSYLSGHVLMYIDKNFNQIEDGMVAAIDRDSVDQERLTLLACNNKDIDFIYTNYSQLTTNLESSKIDFAIWNGDELTDQHSKIMTKDIDLNDSVNTNAVIVIDKTRLDMKKIIQDFIDIDYVKDIQKQIIENKLIPKY